jgi:imidazolonepropionase-like amidohydrolase
MLVRVAHGRGTVASAHITSVVDIDRALDAGADDLAHMVVDREIPDEEIQRIVDQGVLWVPTLELWACNNQTAMAVANLRRFVQAGGQVAMGTVTKGKVADLFAVVGDPLEDLQALEEVMLVIHYGRVIRNELEPSVGPTARFGAQRAF